MADNKINAVEAGFVVIIVLVVEVIELVITFLFPGGGELVKWILNIIVWLPVQFWLKIKGIRGDYYAAASILEFIPFLNAIPTKTIALLSTIYNHNK